MSKLLCSRGRVENPRLSCYIYPMTITQTVEILANSRSITLEVPREIPAGPVVLTFTPGQAAPKDAVAPLPVDDGGKIILTKESIDEMLRDCPHTRALSGILSGMGDVDLDEMRMERLAKHL